MPDDRCPGCARGLQQPLLEQRRVHAAVRAKQQAALIAVGRHFGANVGLAENVDGHAKIAPQRVRVARHDA